MRNERNWFEPLMFFSASEMRGFDWPTRILPRAGFPETRERRKGLQSESSMKEV